MTQTLPLPHDAPQGRIATEFAGKRWRLFTLAFVTGLFTVLTLGFYRFWQKTRLRRWYWSAIRPGGQPLEYVGDPLEKLLGFLIAVVILAFYIGVVNLLLMFASFSLFQGNFAAYLLSFIGVIPVWFYARYRARRYVLARTRWLGLRFGLAPGAWGYAFRALLYWVLTILTLGLLWPLMTFRLEKYRTGRTFYGDIRLEQEGRWTMLFGALKWIGWSVVVGLVTLGCAVNGLVPAVVLGCVVGPVMFLYGLAYYRVETLKRLTATKRAGPMRLTLAARPWRVLWITGSGYVFSAIASAVPSLVLLGLFLHLQSIGEQVTVGQVTQTLAQADRWLVIALSVMTYFGIFLVWTATTHVLVTMPLWRHYATGLTVTGTQHLPQIRQRPRDEHTEAEGFAEALDVGASI